MELAIQKCENALDKAQDYAGLLLFASCSGDSITMENLAVDAAIKLKLNVSLLAYFLLGK